MLEIKNSNPSLYAYEDENEIDRLIEEIETSDAEKVNKSAKKCLTDWLKSATM